MNNLNNMHFSTNPSGREGATSFAPHLQSSYQTINLASFSDAGKQVNAPGLTPNALETESRLVKSSPIPLIQRPCLDQGKPYKNIIRGIVGHPYNSGTLNHYTSKEIVYSFNKANNLYPLITKIEKLLKSLFLSMYSLISRPVYLIKHDKVIIRLFVFLSPKAE